MNNFEYRIDQLDLMIMLSVVCHFSSLLCLFFQETKTFTAAVRVWCLRRASANHEEEDGRDIRQDERAGNLSKTQYFIYTRTPLKLHFTKSKVSSRNKYY